MAPLVWLGLGLGGLWLYRRGSDESSGDLLASCGVGAGPGDEWMQAPTTQDKKLGYKKTDAMTLAMRADAMRARLTEISDQSSGQSPEVEALRTKCIELAVNCASFRDYPQNYASGAAEQGALYKQLASRVDGVAAELADLESRIEPAPEDAPAPPLKAVKVAVPATPTQPATTKTAVVQPPPPAVVVKKKGPSKVAIGLAVVAVVALGAAAGGK